MSQGEKTKTQKKRIEKMITIPRNDYKKPTEVREQVVEALAVAMIESYVFHLCGGNAYRMRDSLIDIKEKKFAIDRYPYNKNSTLVRYHESEMREAFRIVTEAGYHIFRVYEYETWPGYIVVRRGSHNECREVRTFSEMWE